MARVAIKVEGMTCGSCTASIDDMIGHRADVTAITVSLEQELATIDYDPSRVTPEELREAIDDMGFDATLLTTMPAQLRSRLAAGPGFGSSSSHSPRSSAGSSQRGSREGSPSLGPRIIRVRVQGMTCGSCTASIEDMIGHRDGVIKIRVSLENDQALIEYDPGVTCADDLVEAIDDMGFDSRLVPSSATATPHRAGSGSKTRSSGGGGGAAAGEATPGVARIRVEGMTCSSCVASIEDMIGNRNDVIEIKVSLEQELAVVRYQPGAVSPEQLAEAIEDMGFDATVKAGSSRLAVKADGSPVAV